MIIGLDFDNTIVSYDKVFYEVAKEWFDIGAHVLANKVAVRDHLKSIGKESCWTELQGYVYGKRMREAKAYPGLLSFIETAHNRGYTLYIVSHKTQYPFIGPRYDLRKAARQWICKNLKKNEVNYFKEDQVFFESTKVEKIKKLESLRCDIFIDDLPEILLSDHFPKTVSPFLFDPEGIFENQHIGSARRVSSWGQIEKELLYYDK